MSCDECNGTGKFPGFDIPCAVCGGRRPRAVRNPRATNPAYTGRQHPDPRVRGPEVCPHRCDGCPDGLHHWCDKGFDPDDPYYGSADDPDAPLHAAVLAAGGPDLAAAFYACKHCDAWCDAEYVFDLEDGADDAEELYADLGGEG